MCSTNAIQVWLPQLGKNDEYMISDPVPLYPSPKELNSTTW